MNGIHDDTHASDHDDNDLEKDICIFWRTFCGGCCYTRIRRTEREPILHTESERRREYT